MAEGRGVGTGSGSTFPKSSSPFLRGLRLPAKCGGIIAAGAGPFSKGNRISTVSRISYSFTRSIRIGTTKSRRIISFCLGILTNDCRTFSFCSSTSTDGNGIFSFCRSTDTGSQGIIAGSSPIVIVGICTRVDRFDAVIVDTAAAGTATAAIVNQIDHLFQLGHVHRIRVFFPGCHVSDLAGLLGIVDIFRPVPDIMVRRTHRNRC